MADQNPPRLESIYTTRGVNEPLDIAEEDVELIHNNIHPKGRARVRFDFIPRPSLKIDIEFEKDFFDIAHMFSSAIAGQIRFLKRDLRFDVHLIGKFLSTQTHYRIVTIPTQEPITLNWYRWAEKMNTLPGFILTLRLMRRRSGTL